MYRREERSNFTKVSSDFHTLAITHAPFKKKSERNIERFLIRVFITRIYYTCARTGRWMD